MIQHTLSILYRFNSFKFFFLLVNVVGCVCLLFYFFFVFIRYSSNIVTQYEAFVLKRSKILISIRNDISYLYKYFILSKQIQMDYVTISFSLAILSIMYTWYAVCVRFMIADFGVFHSLHREVGGGKKKCFWRWGLVWRMWESVLSSFFFLFSCWLWMCLIVIVHLLLLLF